MKFHAHLGCQHYQVLVPHIHTCPAIARLYVRVVYEHRLSLLHPSCPLIQEEEDLAALHAAMLKASKSVDRSATGSPEIAASGGGGRIGVGDRVEAQFQAGVEWFPAIVTKV